MAMQNLSEQTTKSKVLHKSNLNQRKETANDLLESLLFEIRSCAGVSTLMKMHICGVSHLFAPETEALIVYGLNVLICRLDDISDKYEQSTLKDINFEAYSKLFEKKLLAIGHTRPLKFLLDDLLYEIRSCAYVFKLIETHICIYSNNDIEAEEYLVSCLDTLSLRLDEICYKNDDGILRDIVRKVDQEKNKSTDMH